MPIKLYIYIFGAGLLLASLGGAYWYYSWSQSEIQTLRDNNAKLETAVSTQKDTIDSLESDAADVGEQVVLVSGQYQVARTENVNLRKKLAKHNIAYLAASKPVVVSKILTKATDNAERCFEILSGAPLTAKEVAATKKSQSNGECPGLANPSYIPRR